MQILVTGGIAGFILVLALLSHPTGSVHAQQPTGSIPTVTGTPIGPYITVYSNSDQPFIDVYAGPSSYDYDRIGVLVSLEKAPALGYSPDKDWIEIAYPGTPGGKGWVYAPLVAISPGSLPKLAAPPTPAPRTTPTINPTFVTAYGLQLHPTALPTFTPPPALKQPTFTSNSNPGSKVPYGLVILVLALVGILGATISFLRGNR